MITIIDKKNRGVLNEGRDNGMGFAFLKKNKLKRYSYETVQPISPCKDYLNEPVFTENTGIPSKAFGLNYPKKLNIFKNRGKYNYMVITIMKTKNDTYSYSNSFDNDLQRLHDNYAKLQEFINRIEELFGFNSLTRISKTNKDLFLVELPKAWCTSTITISLYSLLLRVGIYYNNEEPLDFLKEFKVHTNDKYLIQSSLKAINTIIETKKLPEQGEFDVDKAKKYMWSPHNDGICSWNCKYKEELAKAKV